MSDVALSFCLVLVTFTHLTFLPANSSLFWSVECLQYSVFRLCSCTQAGGLQAGPGLQDGHCLYQTANPPTAHLLKLTSLRKAVPFISTETWLQKETATQTEIHRQFQWKAEKGTLLANTDPSAFSMQTRAANCLFIVQSWHLGK